MSDTIIVRPTLYWPPIFWTPDYWAESAREYEWVTPATPLADRPYLDFEVSLDVTLGEVLVTACVDWGMVEGPHMKKVGTKLENEFHRFGFVRVPEDGGGIDEQVGYKWPSTIRVAHNDGSVENVPAMGVTFRELLASSTLGLVEGDVTRPYVYPVRPQGVIVSPGEIAHLTGEAVRAAYAGLDQLVSTTSHVLRRVGPVAIKDGLKAEGIAVTAYGHFAAFRELRAWWRNHRK